MRTIACSTISRRLDSVGVGVARRPRGRGGAASGRDSRADFRLDGMPHSYTASGAAGELTLTDRSVSIDTSNRRSRMLTRQDVMTVGATQPHTP